MAKQIWTAGANFRQKFAFSHKDVTQYFPGHMNKGINQIQRRLKDIDCVIEVHDARIPISGRNPFFKDRVIAARPHVLLFSKVDLADTSQQSFIEEFYKRNGVSKVLWADCSKHVDKVLKRQLVPAITEVIQSAPRYGRDEASFYNVLVVGVPNVGKSSLINSMRRLLFNNSKKVVKVGPQAGVTRALHEGIKVCDKPPIRVLDSPGIMMPNVPDPNVGMKLALCANLKDHLVGEYTIADYMLFWLNNNQRYEYVDYFGLNGPTDDINELLFYVARRLGAIRQVKPMAQTSGVKYRPDFNRAATHVLKDFRLGKLGPVNLDCNVIEKLQAIEGADSMSIEAALKQRANESIDLK